MIPCIRRVVTTFEPVTAVLWHDIVVTSVSVSVSVMSVSVTSVSVAIMSVTREYSECECGECECGECECDERECGDWQRRVNVAYTATAISHCSTKISQ